MMSSSKGKEPLEDLCRDLIIQDNDDIVIPIDVGDLPIQLDDGAHVLGHSGGMACLWKKTPMLNIIFYSVHHIDASVSHIEWGKPLRFTGFYDEPDRSNRHKGWKLLKNLSSQNRLPWVIISDFNDVLNLSEKSDITPQPRWLIKGFKDVIDSSDLTKFHFIGHQFTWEKSRGKLGWIQAKLDRILVNDLWREDFGEAHASSIITSRRDHPPYFSVSKPVNPITVPTTSDSKIYGSKRQSVGR
nr:uncharacterized protein LOC109162712 [Ipomoea batatas]